VNASPLFRLPLIPTLNLATAGAAIGIARAAAEAFREGLRAPSIAPSEARDRENATGAAPVGLALAAVEAAELLLRRDAEALTRQMLAGERPTRVERARYMLDAAFAVASCTQAVDRLFAAGGAGAIRDSSPLQRAFRDLHAMSAHSTLRLDVAAELFSRCELGLPPRSALALI
jgi:hypothetical protein